MGGFNLNSVILALLLLLTVVSAAFAQGQQTLIPLTELETTWLLEHPVIPFASDPNFPPLEYVDEEGKLAGLTMDYLAFVEQQLGVKFKPIPTHSWRESVALVRKGEAYMLSAELKTQENMQHYAFSDSYLKFPMVILARESVVRKQSFEDLSGKRLAVVADYPDVAIIRGKYPDIELVEMPDAVTGLRATAFGQTDAMIIYQPVASYNLEKEGIANLRVVGVADFYSDTAFAVNKAHAILAQILSKALASMPEEEKQRILNRWILLKTDLQFDYKPLIKLYLGAGAVFLILLGWVFQTQHQKKRLQAEVSMRLHKEKELNRVMEQLQEVNQQLEIAVITDPLTGAMNRRGFYELISTEHSRIIRYGGEISLLILDIDHFKQVNDSFGHSTGDQALRKITEICGDVVRAIDVISRIGGEEFALLLPNTSIKNAAILAERIRESVDNFATEIAPGVKLKMTASIGVASYENDDTPDSLLNKADQALYFAKNNGRNQVICYNDIKQAATG